MLKTGRRGIGEFQGSEGRIAADAVGLKQFTIQLLKTSLAELADLLGQGSQRSGFILTVTREKLNRLRVLCDPPPQYELHAARYYLRSDVVRITGSDKSCNISISPQGVASVQSLLRAAANEANKWVEMRARVVHRRGGSRSLLEFIPDTDIAAEAERRRLGEAGTALTAEVWPDDDFADWEQPGA